MKVMVIDDAAWVHAAVKVFLMSRGDIELIDASDGHEAIKKLCEGNIPDLIVLDFNMPGMNGRDFLKILRARPGLSSIPVILSTSEDSSGDVARCLGYAATSFLKKPYTWEQLEAEIRRHLPKR